MPIDEITLNFPRKLDQLSIASRFSREACSSIRDKGIDESFVYDVELAVSEACTNVIKHAGPGESDTVMLIFQVFQDRITIKVKDEGEGFDISKVPLPDFDEHAAGGYGIFIIKSKMDSVEYTTEGTWNVLSMTKFFHHHTDQEKNGK